MASNFNNTLIKPLSAQDYHNYWASRPELCLIEASCLIEQINFKQLRVHPLPAMPMDIQNLSTQRFYIIDEREVKQGKIPWLYNRLVQHPEIRVLIAPIQESMKTLEEVCSSNMGVLPHQHEWICMQMPAESSEQSAERKQETSIQNKPNLLSIADWYLVLEEARNLIMAEQPNNCSIATSMSMRKEQLIGPGIAEEVRIKFSCQSCKKNEEEILQFWKKAHELLSNYG